MDNYNFLFDCKNSNYNLMFPFNFTKLACKFTKTTFFLKNVQV